MVHGAQGTLNHLESPSGSEPLSSIADDDLDPVVAQQEGEHNPGSGEEGTGTRGNDHEVEAAVLEHTTDEKKIPTHPDGVENADPTVENPSLKADLANLDTNEKPETSASEGFDSATLPREEEKTQSNTEHAPPPQTETNLVDRAEPATTEDKNSPSTQDGDAESELGHQDQPSSSTSEKIQLPAETSESIQSVQDEAQETSTESSISLGDAKTVEEDLVDKVENPAQLDVVQDLQASTPALADIERSSVTQDRFSFENEEGKQVEPQEEPSDPPLMSDNSEPEDAQAAVDEPIIDSPETTQNDKSLAETPTKAIENPSASDDASDDAVANQPLSMVTQDGQASSIEANDIQPAESDASKRYDQALRLVEVEMESNEDVAGQLQNISAPDEQFLKDSIQADDAQSGSADSFNRGEPLSVSDETEQPQPASLSADQDDSGISLELTSDDGIPDSRLENDEQSAVAPIAPTGIEAGQDGGNGDIPESELPEGNFDTMRDSGVSMSQSNDSLSDITVKGEPTSEMSSPTATDAKDADGEHHELPEVGEPHTHKADVPMQKDEDAASLQNESPDDIEDGENAAQLVDATELEISTASPTPNDFESLPKGQANGQEQEQAEEPLAGPLPEHDLLDSKYEKDSGDHLKEIALAAGVAATLGSSEVTFHETLSNSEPEEAQVSPDPPDLGDPERPRTADSLRDSDETTVSIKPGVDEAALSEESVPASSTSVGAALPNESHQDDALDRDFKPRASRRDSSTQTEELWRPKTPFMRSVTPAIVLPDANDPASDINSRAELSRTASKRSVQQAEEVVAAAVIIRAAADTLGQTSTRMADAVKGLKQHGTADDALNIKDEKRGTGDAARSLRDSSANRLADVDRISKTDDKPPRSPRQHRSSHGSRSSRPSTRENGSKRHSSHRHRHEGERETEQDSPRTPPRTRDTADSGHRSHRERTPQEQADHDKRKEERRLAREKAKADSPAAESKGKEVEAPPSADRRSSRRHSSTRKENVPSIASTGRTESTAPPQTSKKFFDRNSASVMEGFGGPLTAEASKDSTIKRSSSKTVRRSLSQSQAKLQKARVDESVKASKDKDGKEKIDKERPRESRTISNATSNGNSSTKDRDDKHRKSRLEKREKEDAANGYKEEKKDKKSGGLKGMFKKLFG